MATLLNPSPSSTLAAREIPAQSRARSDRWFHPGMAVAIVLAEAVGFWHSERGRIAGHHALHPMAVVHITLFSGWLALFLVQTLLVASGRTRFHRRLGVVAATVAGLMLLTAPPLAIDLARRGVASSDPLAFLFIMLMDLPLFAVFVGSGIYFRRRAETHKRFMLLATMSLLPPGISRWPIAIANPGPVIMGIVRLYPVNSTTWSVLNLTTTAHYGATMGFMFDETRTTTYAAFQFSGTHAKVFASRNHHGLYESKERCSARVGDTCSTGLGDGGFLQPAGLGYAGWSGIRPDNNIGNITTPLVIDPWMNFGTTPGFKTDCTYADNPARTAYECFLRGSYYNSQTGQLIGYATTFAGWAGSGGTTPYSQLMQDFGFNDSMMYESF